MPKIGKMFICGLMVVSVVGASAVGVISAHDRKMTEQQVEQQQKKIEAQKEKQEQERRAFINEIGPIAKKVNKKYSILPSITIAQACLESDYGNSKLAKKYKNLFGMKSNDKKRTVKLETKEYIDKDGWQTKMARFRVYDSYADSIRSYDIALHQGTSWNKNQYRHVFKAKNYKDQAKALVKDGYATDPGYAEKLIKLIEQYDMERFDK